MENRTKLSDPFKAPGQFCPHRSSRSAHTDQVPKKPVPAGGLIPVIGERMYFEIVSASGGYRARIRGGNNEIMFVTEVYTTKASARHACEVVKNNAYSATIYE